MAKPPQSDDDDGTDLHHLARILKEIEAEAEPPKPETTAEKPGSQELEVPGDGEGVAPKD
jgi:hypothetical protein